MKAQLVQACLVVGNFALAFIFGLIFYWLFRRLRARFQTRMGPPIFQPLADLVKLLSKRTVVPHAASGGWFILSPLLFLMGYVTAASLMPMGLSNPFSATGDLLVVLIALMIPGVALVMAGSSSGNPYRAVRASREAALIVASEIPFLISALTLVKAAGSLSLEGIIEAQATMPFLFKYPLAAMAFLMSIALKLGCKPFDIPDAEVEVVAGPFTEYSGSLLGLFELGNLFRWMVLPALTVNLFLAGGRPTGAPLLDLACFLTLCLVVVFIVSFIDAQSARFKVDRAFKFLLTWGTTLAMADLIRAYSGWLVW